MVIEQRERKNAHRERVSSRVTYLDTKQTNSKSERPVLLGCPRRGVSSYESARFCYTSPAKTIDRRSSGQERSFMQDGTLGEGEALALRVGKTSNDGHMAAQPSVEICLLPRVKHTGGA